MQRKKRTLNAARAQELAGLIENMLIANDKETLNAEYFPQGLSDVSSLVQKFAGAQARLDEMIL